MRSAPRPMQPGPFPVRTATAVALALVVTACGGRREGPDPFGPPGARTVSIEVDNRNFAEATLVAVAEGRRERLGTVSGKSSARYRIRWEQYRPLAVQVGLLAGGRFVTPSVDVAPGETVHLTIELSLESSRLRR